MLFHMALLALCAGAMVRRQVDASGLEAVQQGAWSDGDTSVLEAVAGKLAAFAPETEEAVRAALASGLDAAAKEELYEDIEEAFTQVTSPEWALEHRSLVTAGELNGLANALLVGGSEGETEDTEAEQNALGDPDAMGVGAMSLLNATEGYKPHFVPTYAGWRWDDGVVPYCMDEDLPSKSRKRAVEAMKHWMEKVPGIRFDAVGMQYSGKCKARCAIYFTNYDKRRCFSELGAKCQSIKSQTLNIGRGCTSLGTLIHELGHALGMAHEQTRWDRDEYVTVHFDRVMDGKQHNFEKNWWTNVEGPYDYMSIMHYKEDAFTKNGRCDCSSCWIRRTNCESGLEKSKYQDSQPTPSTCSPCKYIPGPPTITAKDGGQQLGQRIGLSHGDIVKANRMYPL